MQKASDVLMKVFLAWQAEQGRRKSVADYAEWLGVNPGSLAKWLDGSRRPDQYHAYLIAPKVGAELLDALGYERPDPRLQAIIARWGELPEDVQAKLADLALRGAQRRPAARPRRRVARADGG